MVISKKKKKLIAGSLSVIMLFAVLAPAVTYAQEPTSLTDNIPQLNELSRPELDSFELGVDVREMKSELVSPVVSSMKESTAINAQELFGIKFDKINPNKELVVKDFKKADISNLKKEIESRLDTLMDKNSRDLNVILNRKLDTGIQADLTSFKNAVKTGMSQGEINSFLSKTQTPSGWSMTPKKVTPVRINTSAPSSTGSTSPSQPTSPSYSQMNGAGGVINFVKGIGSTVMGLFSR